MYKIKYKWKKFLLQICKIVVIFHIFFIRIILKWISYLNIKKLFFQIQNRHEQIYLQALTVKTNVNHAWPPMAIDGVRQVLVQRMVPWLHEASKPIGGHAWPTLVFSVWYCNLRILESQIIGVFDFILLRNMKMHYNLWSCSSIWYWVERKVMRILKSLIFFNFLEAL